MRTRNLPGLTLTEVLIYLALFGAIFAIVLQFSLDIQESNNRSQKRAEIEKYSVFVDQHLADAFAESDAVSIPRTSFNNDQGELGLNTITGGSIDYSFVDEQLTVNRGGGETDLTPDYAEVTRFYLEQVLDEQGTTVGVRLDLDIQAKEDPEVTTSIETNYVLAAEL